MAVINMKAEGSVQVDEHLLSGLFNGRHFLYHKESLTVQQCSRTAPSGQKQVKYELFEFLLWRETREFM